MIGGATVIIQLAFITHAHARAKEVEPKHIRDEQLSMDNLVNKMVDNLFDRVLKSSPFETLPLHNLDVDGTMLGKPSQVGMSSSSILGPQVPLRASHPSAQGIPAPRWHAASANARWSKPQPLHALNPPKRLNPLTSHVFRTAAEPADQEDEESSPVTSTAPLAGMEHRRRGMDPATRRRGRALTQPYWQKLSENVQETKSLHLRDLLQDESRCSSMFRQWNGITLDYSRQKVTQESMELLYELARAADVEGKRKLMFQGFKINEDEDRPVLHVALRAKKDQVIKNGGDGDNVVPQVYEVLDKIQDFSEKVRSGEYKGYTGKPLTDVLAIGIGGSYLGTEFVFEAIRTWPAAAEAAKGRRVRFLANVDPIDVRRALDGLSAENTLVIVNSKTFTTAETMLNARTVKDWIIKELGSEDAVAKHVVACSTAIDKTDAFGINSANVFRFWDWVGGRFSVTSAIGVLPLSLQYGFDVVREFLDGANDMDEHFATAPIESNLPTLLGLLAVWNLSCLNHEGYAVLPYCQALVRFVAHIQQLDMESNGKRVRMDGSECPGGQTGGVYFGEPGTNGQHSFYQLLHQGRTIPADFIGFKESQDPIKLPGEEVANHDELMSNFFAQPDALALGYTEEQCRAAGVPEQLVAQKTFEGDRPTLSILMPTCSPYYVGNLLALYEHRTAVQGWVWDINSFDQWGVELGKVLGKKVRGYLAKAREGTGNSDSFPAPTQKLLQTYLGKT